MNGFTPNNNTNVIRLLSEAIRKCNKGRNRILMGAVVLCILTLTFVFGTAYGKINAEYTKNIRMDGTTASTYIEEGTKQQYEKARSLGYVRETGRRMKMGEATESGKKESICSIQVLDQTAWEKMMKPAYTGVHGTYPKKQQEIMLPVKTLKKLGIDNPKRGMKIALDISISFFQTEKEEFELSGWYSAYTEDNGRSKAIGYVSEKKLKDWGYDIEEDSDILICQSNYTEQTGRKKRHRRRPDLGKGTFNKKKRSETQELCFMAWKNVTRYRQRFVITVISMFLGIEMFLIVMVIITGSDYANIINQRPDFLIAGEFSEFAKKEGSGTEYQTQSPDQDPMKSEGDNFELLYDNEYGEFSPISEKVRNRLWNLDGVKKKKSYITEGAYMLSSISRDGLRPLEKDTYLGKNVEYAEESSTDYESGAKMIEGLDADTVQIVSENELKALKTYVEKNKLKVNMDSLENGTGVMIIHDHKLSQKQERQAEKAVGETVCLSPLKNKETCIRWNSMTDKERDKEDGIIKAETPSTEYTLSGYLDNQADDFPEIHQTWHGAEGDIYYLVSEKGFNRLPTKRKTFCMELNVEKKKEKNIMYEIQKILSAENQRRKSNTQTSLDGEGEAGIFYIARSDLMQKNADYIRGNRIMFGSISVILLCVGLVNYFNIMFTGIVGRKKELEIMRKIGMTRRQERKLLLLEGSYYVLLIAGLAASVGSIILKGINVYMRKQLSYFTFHYPIGAIAGSIVILEIVCVIICNLLILKKMKK